MNLPENSSSINVIEIKAGNLSVDSIQAAIENAGKTKKADLIVIRTNNSAYKVTFADKSDKIVINIDSAKYGALNVVALGTRPLTINANNQSRAVHISTGTVGLGNIRIVDGKTAGNGAGLYLRNGELTTSDVTFKNNTAVLNDAKEEGCGGGVYVRSGSFSAINTSFGGNSAKDCGGGVYVESGTFVATNSSISGNTATNDGAGVYVKGGTFTANSSTISENISNKIYKGGGGVYVGANATFNAINSPISANKAYSGGGVCVNGGTFVASNGTTISNNSATTMGGGVYVNSGAFTAMDGTPIVSNSATLGGGVYVVGGTFTATKNTISGNSVGRYGGGVYVYTNGTFNAINTTISGNSATDQDSEYPEGGGVYVIKGTFNATDGTTISNNSATSTGAVYVSEGTFAATDVKIVGNSSGVYCDGTFTAINTTISKNSGAGVGFYGTFNATNTTISGNSGNGVSGSGTFTAINTTISENSGKGVNFGGTFTATNTTITKNSAGVVFYFGSTGTFNATNTTITRNSGTGVDVQHSGTFNATNTIIAGNSGSGVNVNVGGTFNATNTTIAGNSTGSKYEIGGVRLVQSTFTAKNVLVAGNFGEQLFGTTSPESSNNIFGTTLGTSAAFVCAPVFDQNGVLTNADSLDLHLRCDSKAIDAGSNAAVVGVTTDLDGKPRISNGTVDVGAYEYVYTGNEIPTAPSELKFGEYDPKAAEVLLTWKDNSSNETGFQVEYTSDDGKTWLNVGATMTNKASLWSKILYTGNKYMFRVRAVCGNYCSEWAYSSTLNLVVDAPSDVKIAIYDRTTRNYVVTWQDNSDDETGFQVYCMHEVREICVKSIKTEANVTSVTISGLEPPSSASYRFRVQAVRGNVCSETAYSQSFSCLITDAPSDLTFGECDADSKSVFMSWKDNSNGETGFQVEMSTDGGSTWVLADVTKPNVTSRTAWGLKANEQYLFRICALYGETKSDWTGSEPFHIEVGAPSDLTLGTYDDVKRSVTISWKDNSDNETGFRVEYSTDEGVTWKLSEVMSANSTTRTAWGLKPNMEYVFRVCAFNGKITSDWAVSDPLKTDVKAPNAPSDLTFENYDVAKRSVYLSWQDNSDDETGFRVEYSIDKGVTWNLSQVMAADSTSRTAWGLRTNAQYVFRVCALKGKVASEWTYSDPLIPSDSKIPNAPSDLTVSNYDATKRSATLTWKDNSDVETGFRVEYSTDNGTTWRLSQIMAADSTSRTAWGIKANTQYDFRVCAFNEAGCSDWVYATLSNPVQKIPEAPGDLTVDNYDATKRSATLSWTDNSDNETGFRVEYSTDGGTTWRLSQIMSVNSTSRTAWGLKANTEYLFRVRAFNESGASDWTYSKPFYVGVKAPGDLKITDYDATTGSATLTWIDNSDDETGFLVQYSTDGRKTWKAAKTVGANCVSTILHGLKTNCTIRIRAIRGDEYSDWIYVPLVFVLSASVSNESVDVPATGGYVLTTPVAVSLAEREAIRATLFQNEVENVENPWDSDVDFAPKYADNSNESELFADLFDDLLAFEA